MWRGRFYNLKYPGVSSLISLTYCLILFPSIFKLQANYIPSKKKEGYQSVTYPKKRSGVMISPRSILTALTLALPVFSSPVPSPASDTSSDSGIAIGSLQQVNLRIEGRNSTIFEGIIFSGPRNITTASGGTHACNGLNDAANPKPGATPTTALDAANKLSAVLGGGFGYDGTWDAQFSDYFITSIGNSPQTSTQFWGILVNYQYTPTGGCQYETSVNDQVLWAFDSFNQQYFLKLTGPIKAVNGVPFTVNVVDGMTGQPRPGASVGGATTDANGNALVTASSVGLLKLKASAPSSIRSNALNIIVV
jgi:hypothetical protein